MSLRVFVINLASATNKLKEMKRVTASMADIVSLNTAVYGKELSDSVISTIYDSGASIAKIGRGLTKGEIGCALSHLKCLTDLLSREDDYALILEDDVIFDFDESFINDITDKLESNWDVVLLGHHSRYSRYEPGIHSIWTSKKVNQSLRIVKFKERPVGAYGYLVSRKGAEKLLSKFKVISMPFDHWELNKGVDIFGVYPPVISLNPKFIHEDSVLDSERKVACKMKTKNNTVKSLVLPLYKNILKLIP
jgi:glycosyl transferase family 25